MSGLSWQQIADKHHVEKSALYWRMKTDAEKRDDIWPIRRVNKATAANKVRFDSVDALLIREEIKEFKQNYGVLYKDLAVMAGLKPNTIQQITGGFTKRVSRDTAKRIMIAISNYEKRKR